MSVVASPIPDLVGLNWRPVQDAKEQSARRDGLACPDALAARVQHHEHGWVTLRTHAEHGRILIEIEDECGGLAASETEKEMFRAFGDRRAKDRSGLGLGLSISRRAVQASGGEIRSHNLPGKGCIFTIDLPAAA